jgi:hypothetical protein
MMQMHILTGTSIVAEVAEARQAYPMGNVQRGTVEDLLRELDSRRHWSGVPTSSAPCVVRLANNPHFLTIGTHAEVY